MRLTSDEKRAPNKISLDTHPSTNDPASSDVPSAVIDADHIPDERLAAEKLALFDAALANSRDFVAALKTDSSKYASPGKSKTLTPAGGVAELLGSLPASVYDDVLLRDAWGSPIVFMAANIPGSVRHPKTAFSSSPPARTVNT